LSVDREAEDGETRGVNREGGEIEGVDRAGLSVDREDGEREGRIER
jgi:hypothetical protein